MLNIFSLIISIISLISSIIIAIRQNKQTNNSTKIANQGNNLTNAGNNIANYSANVQIKELAPILFNTSQDFQTAPASTASNAYSTTLKVTGYLTTTFGSISWIGTLVPNYFPAYSFDATNISQSASTNKNNSYFDTTFTITRTETVDNFIRSRVYICTLDSNFNISINLIQLIVERLSESSIREVIVDSSPDGPYHFKAVDGFYRCFTEYELLTYKTLRLIKPWIDSKSSGSMSLKSQEKISTIFEDNEPFNLIQNELKEIRSHITSVTG
ncbi:hypothetical protein [Lactiplantibacillus plantarum]|uniref:Uncharacterized protein n=1 Tax=Lactiplantibacillus plantarum (strain ATCC BAA-793 / NCIMB 8826 / WCFS1) TaxID=220668 RepID=F9UPV9_LACPL|nr:hypothetical protein [Lactiplantibacillus plantarum]ALF14416.1 hypothetical protein AKJ11_04610 [Lactiplantibacillus plantarum]AWI40592.1 hypothetical protein LpLQ80_08670 [Lactiplantibacillus plantarum]MDE4415426.1 hypothetical protein [Lactiplantibacillus plantarum]MDE4417997.1 hypothetical protein [Lactiplantibacillus plantarum]MDE4421220.1 hypothetical protein [Lactiplantibacillus plantarum]